MNLLEALERKKALHDIIQHRTDSLSAYLEDDAMLSVILTEIDSLVDQYFSLERLIQKRYENTMVSPTESISDIISYVDGFTKKIEALKYLYSELIMAEIKTGKPNVTIDTDNIMASIRQYEEMKNMLIKKIKDVCFNTHLSTPSHTDLG